eukprot:g4532.t1
MEIRTHSLMRLEDLGFPSAGIPNRAIIGTEGGEDPIIGATGQAYSKIVKPGDCILVDIVLDEAAEHLSAELNEYPSAAPSSIASSPVLSSKAKELGYRISGRLPTVLSLDMSSASSTGAKLLPGAKEDSYQAHTKPYYTALHRAGPREKLHFKPSEVTAAIVTCGGLCPGLNAVICHIVQTLWHNYSVRKIMGIRGGFHGMSRFGGDFDFAEELFSDNEEHGYLAGGRRLSGIPGAGDGTDASNSPTLLQHGDGASSAPPPSIVVKAADGLQEQGRTTSELTNMSGKLVTAGSTSSNISLLLPRVGSTAPAGSRTPGSRKSPKGGNSRAAIHGAEFRPIVLTPDAVADIQHLGGTILGSTRGGFDLERISAFLEKNNVSMLFIAGGDGTHRGAFKVSEYCIERRKNIAVCGIPKTIDNDIGLIDRSFGFLTAVEEAKKAIFAAKVEASSNMPNGIGIVKLMGRSAGFISVFATISMGSGVDLCLIPEVNVILEGPKGILPHLHRVIEKKGHAVVVVAEGAGEELMTDMAKDTDKSGNKKLPKIGEFMTSAIKEFFQKKDKEVTIKYIDPSYMIRSVGPNVLDAYDCMVLSSGAVHAAMAGITGFSIGMVNNYDRTRCW